MEYVADVGKVGRAVARNKLRRMRRRIRPVCIREHSVGLHGIVVVVLEAVARVLAPLVLRIDVSRAAKEGNIGDEA